MAIGKFMNLDLMVVKLFYESSSYHSYSPKLQVDPDSKELKKLHLTLSDFHSTYPDRSVQSTEELALHFYTLYPAVSPKEKEVFDTLFEALSKVEIDKTLGDSYLQSLQERSVGRRLAFLGMDLADGKKTFNDVVIESEGLLEGVLGSGPAEQSPFASSSLMGIYEATAKSPGLRWPLKALNQSLGSIRKGDYGIVFARPETGKTTLIADVARFMAPQTELPIIWFNNEQAAETVYNYIYRATLGITNEQLYADLAGNEKKYKDLTGDRIRIFDSASIHKGDVEKLLQMYDAGLIFFDQIDALKGFSSDRHDLELGEIYQWARGLAKKYAPVVGVCQAGESGANKKYLTMEDIVNAKTSKQATADWILGVGKMDAEGMEKVRHFSICKNKLIGDKDSVPALRHGKLDVLIHPEICRYGDVPNS